MYKRNIEARSYNHCCSRKAVSMTFWVCVCSRSYTACNAHAPYCHLRPYRLYHVFPNYLINGTIFEKKKILGVKCRFWFSVQFLSETFLVLRRIQQNMIKNVYWSSRNLPLFRYTTWIFEIDCRKILEYQISWKSVVWEPRCSMRADRQKDGHAWGS